MHQPRHNPILHKDARPIVGHNTRADVAALSQVQAGMRRLTTLLVAGALGVAACALMTASAWAVEQSSQPNNALKPHEAVHVGQKAPITPSSPGVAPERTAATQPGADGGSLVFANLEDLLILAAEVGSARFEVGTNNDRYVAGSIDGINYAIDVYNCDPDCADITFTASFEVANLTADLMNEWNASRRFGKAYIRDDGDAVIQFAINTRHGVAVDTLRDDLVWWETVLEDYVTFVGFR